MIKIKSKNVDVTKLNQMQEEYQATGKEVFNLHCDGTEEGSKKFNKERNSIMDKQRGIKLKYMKEFYKLFDGHCIRVSSQGQSSDFYEVKDVKIVKTAGKKLIEGCYYNVVFNGDMYSVKAGNSRSVCKSIMDANKQGNSIIRLFDLENYGTVTITEITKKEFEEQYKNAIPKDIPHDVELKLTPWSMATPRTEFEELADMKRLHVEVTLANTSVLLAKERIKNLCLYQNMANDVAACKDKKLKTCMHKQFLAEIEKSDKKIETFERRIAKNKESLEKKLYLVKKDKKKS